MGVVGPERDIFGDRFEFVGSVVLSCCPNAILAVPIASFRASERVYGGPSTYLETPPRILVDRRECW